MASSWRERRKQLDRLLPEIADLVRQHLDDLEDEARQAVRSRSLGHLVDLADHIRYTQGNEAHQTLHRLTELELVLGRDFSVLHTLSQQPQISSRVRAVTARSLGTSSRVYVMKSISKLSALRLEGQTSMQRERDILKAAVQAKRPDVIQLVSAFQDPDDLHILLEYLPAGDLGLLLEERKAFPEDWVRIWAAEIVQALHWLHRTGYVHRDVKPSNLLLTGNGHAKLADFGSAAPLVADRNVQFVPKKFCLTPVGTVDYIAPDILLAHELALEENSFEKTLDLEAAGPYDSSVDFWSLGVAIFEMLSGVLPFYADSIPDTYERIANHKESLAFPPDKRWSSTAKLFLQGLLTSADSRLGRNAIKEIHQHTFFTGVSWTTLHQKPGPFKPSLRQLDAQSDASISASMSKGFDFSALFSSPGLSILRPEAAECDISSGRAWIGFSYFPEDLEFDARLDDLSYDKLVASKLKASIVPNHPFTPARSSKSPYAQSSNKRRLQNATALKEVVTYGIMKTAKKVSAAYTLNAKGEPPALSSGSTLRDLESRQRKLVEDAKDIEARYNDLFNLSRQAV